MAGGYLLCALSFSMVEGSYNNIIRIFTEDQTGHVQIHKGDYIRKPKVHKTIDDQARVREVLEAQAEVTAFAPRIYLPALAYAGENSSPTQVIGVDPELEPGTSRMAQKITRGAWPQSGRDAEDYYQVVIGQGIADALELDIGGELILISQGADGSVANDIYRVSGIIGTSRSADRINVVMPLSAAQEFAALEGRVHEYAIVLSDIALSRTIAAELAQALPELSASPWQVVQETFYKSMEADKRGNRFTLGIVLFIVFIGVLNTVLMSVLERTREFGVLKAIGSRPATILALIGLETSMLAVASIIAGLALAIPAIAWFQGIGLELPEPVDMGGVSFSHMTGEFSLEVFVIPMIVIFGYAVLVSIPPGIRAARVAPIQAMRTF